MSSKQVIKTSNAPDPVGPYNQAIKAGDFIYCSGQIAIDPSIKWDYMFRWDRKGNYSGIKKSRSSS